MTVFDCVESQLALEHGDDGQILIYDLLSVIYLCLKVDGRIFNVSFLQFLLNITTLSSYNELRQHVTPGTEPLGWSEDIYPGLEYEILTRLNFKTELVSNSQIAFELIAAFQAELEGRQGSTNQSSYSSDELNSILLGAQYRSYLCTLGKSSHLRPLQLSETPLGFKDRYLLWRDKLLIKPKSDRPERSKTIDNGY
jgi:hypothetical protein